VQGIYLLILIKGAWLSLALSLFLLSEIEVDDLDRDSRRQSSELKVCLPPFLMP